MTRWRPVPPGSANYLRRKKGLPSSAPPTPPEEQQQHLQLILKLPDGSKEAYRPDFTDALTGKRVRPVSPTTTQTTVVHHNIPQSPPKPSPPPKKMHPFKQVRM